MNNELEQAIQDLKALPSARLSVASNYIHGLLTQSIAERNELLDKAFSICLSDEETQAWQMASAECRKIEGNCDVETW